MYWCCYFYRYIYCFKKGRPGTGLRTRKEEEEETEPYNPALIDS